MDRQDRLDRPGNGSIARCNPCSRLRQRATGRSTRIPRRTHRCNDHGCGRVHGVRLRAPGTGRERAATTSHSRLSTSTRRAGMPRISWVTPGRRWTSVLSRKVTAATNSLPTTVLCRCSRCRTDSVRSASTSRRFQFPHAAHCRSPHRSPGTSCSFYGTRLARTSCEHATGSQERFDLWRGPGG